MLVSPIIIIIIIIIIIFCFCEFFITVLASGLSQESEWQQVSSGIQDFPQYSDRSQHFCNVDGLYSSSDLLLFQFPFHFFGNHA